MPTTDTILSDRAALLRRILETPEDDAPRLILSDILEEEGEDERAEFIRDQCEIAKLQQQKIDLFNEETDWSECSELSANWCPNCGDCSCKNPEDSKSDDDCPLHAPHSRHCCYENLLNDLHYFRECETRIVSGSSEWLTFGIGSKLNYVWNGNGGNGFCVVTSEGVEIVWQRGFISEIRLTCEQFMKLGETCKACSGRGYESVYERGEYGPNRYQQDCDSCNGSGKLPSLAERIFSEHPVTRVVLTDRKPERLPTTPVQFGWYCHNTEASIVAQSLPADIYMKLTRAWNHSTEQAALDALSAACCRYGRTLVGLPPLNNEV